MDNTSEKSLNSTLPPVNDFSFNDCLKESHFGVIVQVFFLSLCFLVGTPAHSWCLWLQLRFGCNIKQTQVFPLNHTIMELIVCISCAIKMLNRFAIRNEYLFILTNLISSMNWVSRPLMQTCICTEQYLAVHYPVTFLRYKAKSYRIVAVAVAWLMTLGVGVYGVQIHSFPDPLLNSVLVITVMVISFSCVSLLCTLKNPGPGATHSKMKNGRDVRNQQKKNAFNKILSALLIVLITYVPYLVITTCAVLQVNLVWIRCYISPIMNSISLAGVIITSLLKMYKEGQIKCCKQAKGGDTTSYEH